MTETLMTSEEIDMESRKIEETETQLNFKKRQEEPRMQIQESVKYSLSPLRGYTRQKEPQTLHVSYSINSRGS